VTGSASRPRRIVLVGFMGSGKTSVGRALAELLGWSFADLDALVEERTGSTVAEIFRTRGEEAFREEERAAAVEACQRDRVVIATGGGAFARAETRRILGQNALSVFLECDLEVLLARIPADGRRPLAGNRETMRRLYAEREFAYRLADRTVDATRTGPRELAVQIAAGLGLGSFEGPSGA
jgi:shikimate kinase